MYLECLWFTQTIQKASGEVLIQLQEEFNELVLNVLRMCSLTEWQGGSVGSIATYSTINN